MQEYEINVSNIEELQMINNVAELEQIFSRAKSVIVQGETVSLVRQNADGTTYKFEEITTEADLENYKQAVLKYL
jgi:hypothetical protein